MQETLKFSGMSYPDGTTIYGKKYGVQIDKDGYKIIKKRMGLFIYLYPIFDLILLAMFLTRDQVINFIVSHFAFNITYKPLHGSWLLLLNIFIAFINYGIPILIVGAILWLYFKHQDYLLRLARWHGCEHKVIDAAEKGDIDSAELSSPVNIHCGSTYMVSLCSGLIVWYLIVKIPVGLFSLIFLIMYFESKIWHKKNWIGIKVGSWLQKKVLTREPTDEQLEMGKRGISALIVRERNG